MKKSYETLLKKFAQSDENLQALSAIVEKIVDDRTVALQEQNEQYRFFMNQANVLMLTLDADGTVAFANQHVYDVTGYTAEELLGRNWIDIAIPREQRDTIHKLFERIMRGEQKPYEHYESHIITKDGALRLIDWNNHYNRDVVTGEIIGTFSTGRDITISRGLEDALHANEIRYRQMFYSNNAIKLVINPQSGDIIEANQAACEFYGYPYEILTAMNITQISVNMTEGKFVPEKLNGDIQQSFMRRHRLANGEIRDVEIYTGPYSIEDETLRFSVIIDMTERERAKRDLQRQESQLRTIVNQFPGGILLFDIDLNIIMAHGDLDYMSSALEHLNGKNLRRDIPEHIWEASKDYYYRVLDGELTSHEFIINERFYIEQIIPVYDDDTIVGGLQFIQDVTDVRQSKRILQETQKQLHTLLDGVIDGVAIVTQDEYIVYVNEKAAEIVGYESAAAMRQAVQGRLVIPFEPCDENGNKIPFEEQGVYHALQGDIPAPQVTVFRNPETDQKRWVEIKAKPIFDNDATLKFAVVIMTDITRAREMEQIKLKVLQEKAQIETLRTYIANTTHDLAQPLSVINTSLYMLDRLVEDERVQRRTEIIRVQAARIYAMLQDIQQISLLDSLSRLEFQEVQIALLIQQIAQVYQAEFEAKHLLVNLEIDEPTTEILGNAQYIERAIKHVLQNAIDYSHTGDAITIRCYVDDTYLAVEIQDTGIGIPEEALERIMERFYRVDSSRTIGPRSSTGLGLSITKRIMELHGGEIRVTSVVKEGTTVRLLFRLVHEA